MAFDNAVVTIEALPAELLFEIFGQLDGPPPSDGRLHKQPSHDMLTSSDCPLKHISLVSKRWRAIVLPLLFQHVLWSMNHAQLATHAEHIRDANGANTIPFFAFLLANDLGRRITSITMIASDLPLSPDNAPAPLLPPRVGRDPIATEPDSPHAIKPAVSIIRNDYSWLWGTVFSFMDPLRFTIIAAPQTLAKLFALALYVEDADLFDDAKGNFHILSVSRTSKSLTSASADSTHTYGPDQQTAEAHDGTLFRIRPWTDLLLNENSSIRVYKNYEYFGKHPPSILNALLCGDDTTGHHPLVPPTLQSLSYVAIFPLPGHFLYLLRFLPRIQHLFVQLGPRSSDILCDAKEMDHVQPADLWLEHDRCLSGLAHHLRMGDALDALFDNMQVPMPFSPNWRHLSRFELGDADDQEVWNQFVGPGSPPDWSSRGWRIERRGVLVGCPPTRQP